MSCAKPSTIIKVSILIIFDILDLVADWLQWRDVKYSSGGAALGVHRDGVSGGLLALSIIASITLCIELYFHAKRCKSDGEGATSWKEIIFTVFIFLEDVPQISLTIYIASVCVSTASTFQILKGVACVLEGLIKLVFAILELFDKEKKHDKKGLAVKSVLMAGCVIMLGSSVAVFVLAEDC